MLENVLDRILKNHQRVLEKWLKICVTMFPYLKCSSMKPWGNGSRTSNIEDLDICCGATEGSEQQHKGRRILEFITFYHNALHLIRVHCAMNNSNKKTGKFGG